MNNLTKIIDKLFQRQEQLTVGELSIFIDTCHSLIFPKPLTSDQLTRILQFPYLNMIIQYYIDNIEFDPCLFKIELVKIFDKNNNLIKITICELK